MFNQKSKIYAIADWEACNKHGIDILDFIKAIMNGGVRIIQYRDKANDLSMVDKTFGQIVKIIEPDVRVIINDYSEIAQRYKTAVHVGQDDVMRSPGLPFGRSTHSITEIINALKENPQPDYIGFGTMFPSFTKPDIASAQSQLNVLFDLWKKDVVLIGGITLENLDLLPSGDRIYYAIINDFFASGDRPWQVEKRAEKLSGKLL